MAISAVSMSNRVSIAASVGLLLVFAAPSQLPAVTANGVLGSVLIAANPVSAGLKMAGLVLIDQETVASQWTLLISPVVAAILLTFVAIRLSNRVRLGGAR
jgi:ABC-2 type transport system permease protein